MNKRIINSIIQKKFNHWINSIKDDNVKKLVKENSILTGGAIASLLQKESPNDFDIYFKTHETVLAVAKYYVDRFNFFEHHGTKAKIQEEIQLRECDATKYNSYEHYYSTIHDEEDDDDNYMPNEDETRPESDFIKTGRIKIFISSKGVSGYKPNSEAEEYLNRFDRAEDGTTTTVEELISDMDELPVPETTKTPGKIESKDKDVSQFRPIFLTSNSITLSDKIQLVIRFHGDVEEIHKNFDYVHCTNSWESKDGNLILRSDALLSILTKELKYVGSLYPLASVVRMRKFLKRGWHINAGQILKMSFQIADLNLHDIAVLEDQLVGVDTTYFRWLINDIKKAQSDDNDFKIDNGYISTIVDKIF